jgi:hypothetical protein
MLTAQPPLIQIEPVKPEVELSLAQGTEPKPEVALTTIVSAVVVIFKVSSLVSVAAPAV